MLSGSERAPKRSPQRSPNRTAGIPGEPAIGVTVRCDVVGFGGDYATSAVITSEYSSKR